MNKDSTLFNPYMSSQGDQRTHMDAQPVLFVRTVTDPVTIIQQNTDTDPNGFITRTTTVSQC